MPLKEYEENYATIMEEVGLCMSFLLTPTTSEERIQKIDALSSGFVYAVSASSTTGTKKDFSAEQEKYFKRLKSLKLQHPHLIGFGISDKETFSTACRYGRGAIIGSAFINMLQQSSQLDQDIPTFIKAILKG